jgi:hypothetical protein
MVWHLKKEKINEVLGLIYSYPKVGLRLKGIQSD